ncbi:uncharacterized protein LOC119829254 [Zerene cesonia]|uniref:uncharacterized protein LOC119829254 n=1 Tax=Zerene cesonia TaxID=33412 RepID=UPI0018E53BE2|nr:uncharacterized protein LOC119829254 [Zerene cesonia]
MKENILITSSSLSKFNDTLHKIKINEARLNDAIDELSVKLRNITKITENINIESKINSILSSLEASMLTLSFQLADITNAIILSSQNILHPSVLPPTQLYLELVDNYRYLPVDYKLPVSLELSNVHILMNLSRVICYSLYNKIIFILKIPLVSPNNFNLYRSIALPTPYMNSKSAAFSFVLPNSKYIAVTSDKSEYCKLDTLTNCKNINDNNYLCDVLNIFSSMANPCCESEILLNTVNKMPDTCQTEFIHGKLDIWKTLENNNWLFIQSHNNKLFIECPQQTVIEENIYGIGIVHVPRNCKAFCKSTKLIPKSNEIYYVNFTNSPALTDFHINNDSCCNLDKFMSRMDNESPLELVNIDLDAFTEETKNRLKTISAASDKIINQNPIIKYGTHYSILLSLVLVLMFLFCIFKIYKLMKLRGLTLTLTKTPVENPSDSPVTIEIPNEPEIIPSPSIRRNL